MRARVLCAFLFVSLLSTHVQAFVKSNGTGGGNWSNTSTWAGGVLPTAVDSITIQATDVVTVDTPTATASTTTINGTLSFSRSASSTMTVVGGNLNVNSGGTLNMGTSGSPLNASSATLILAYGKTAGQYGLIVNAGGNFLVYGAAKTPMTTLVSPSSIGKGSAGTFTVADTTGWQVGDKITIDTEAVTIATLPGSNQVTINQTLGQAHYSSNTVLIGNLTRNVVVRSSGTNTGTNTAYIVGLTTSTANFNLTYGEFSYLGANANGVFGLNIDGADGGSNVTGSISSCTFHHGYLGLIDSGKASLISNSLFYANAFGAIESDNPGALNVFTGNFLYANGSNGAFGLFQSVNNTVQQNVIFSNQGEGLWLNGTYGNIISTNTIYSSQFDGFDVNTSSGNTCVANVIYSNGGYGITMETPKVNSFFNNIVSTNTSGGVYLSGGFTNTFSGNRIYANSGFGLTLSQSSGVVSTGDYYGYNAALSSLANSSSEIFLDHTVAASNAVMYAPQINPATGIDTTGFSKTTAYLVSYNQNSASGTVRVYGDYAISGSTFTLDYASDTYVGAGDGPVQKKLYFGKSATASSTWNNNTGRSKLTVAPGGGFHAVGVSTAPTIITMLGGSTYYAFVDSGVFTVQYASFTDMNENGIQLWNSGPFSINHSTFDVMGSSIGTVSSRLFTLNGVTNSTITLIDVTYGNTGAAANKYNYTISGSSAGLSWTNFNYTGALAGAAHEQADPGNRIAWTVNTCQKATSRASGSWGAYSTWDVGFVPTSCNAVDIAVGTTVTLDADVQASTTNIYGTLSASRIYSSTLTIVGGDIDVQSGGTLDMGTSGSPINASSATLILAYGATNTEYGLNVNSGGNFMTYGEAKTPTTTSASDIPASAGTITVGDATGWQNGDQIIIDTEVVRITSVPSGNSFSITAPTFAHYSSNTIRISNLSRNVVIRSSGTDINANSSYVWVDANSAPVIAYTDIDYMGDLGVVFNAVDVTATVSSSTIRYGNTGIYLNNANGCLLNGNILFGNQDSGIVLNVTSGNRVISNQLVGNALDGITFGNSSNILVSGNVALANQRIGYWVIGTSNTVSNNIASNNAGVGFYVNSSASQLYFSSNTSYGNYNGFELDSGSGNLFDSNTAHDNSNIGIDIEGDNNTLKSSLIYSNHYGMDSEGSDNLFVGNQVSSSSAYGIIMDGADCTWINNYLYSNGNAGIIDTGSTNTWLTGGLGYNPAGTPLGDLSTEISFFSSDSLTFKNTAINPSPGITTVALPGQGSVILSYNQNAATGTVRVFGDYAVSASTFTLDYSTTVYTSTATLPMLMRGAGHSASVTSTNDANAVSQLVTITYSGGNWIVTGSSTPGTLCTIGGPSGSAACGSPTQFNLSITGSSPQNGDSLNFALAAGSQDGNVQKRLYFGPADSGFNHGRSKIAFAAGAGFHAIGVSTAPTLVTQLSPNGTYYSFVDSGTFNVQYASFTNMDENGVQLSNSGPFSINNSTFDFMGSGVGASSRLFTLAKVTQSTITLTDVTYGSNGAAANKYNYTISGSSVGLLWTNQNYGGPLAGDAFEEADPPNRIRWNTIVPTAPAVTAVSSASVTVVWTSTSPSAGYAVDAATSSNFHGTVLSTVTLGGAVTSLVVDSMTSLAPDTTYFIRVGNLYNGTTMYSPTILSTSTLTSPIANARVYQTFATSMTVNWAPLAAAQGYRLEASSTNFNGTGTIYFSSNTSVSASTLTVAGLDPNVGYALRVGGLNWNNVPNYAVLANPVNMTAWVTVSAGSVYPIRNITGVPTVGTAITGIASPTGIAITPNGLTAWVADSAGKAWPITGLATTPTLGTAVTGMTAPAAIAITPDGTTAWVADTTGHEVWPITNLGGSPTLGTPVTGMNGPNAIAITPDGNTAWVLDYSGHEAWPINNLKTAPTLGTPVTGLGGPLAIAISPDGTYAWVSDDNGKAWPINSLNATPTLGTAVTGITGARGIVMSSDGNTAVVSTAFELFPINNLKTAPTLGSGIFGVSRPTTIALSPDGTIAMMIDTNGGVGKVWPLTQLNTSPTLGAAVTGFTALSSIAIGAVSYLAPTLTASPSSGQIFKVMVSSITANWAPLSTGSGYQLDVSTDSAFHGVLYSSSTTDVNQSTLTVSGLAANTSYYLRLGGINSVSSVNYVALGSTVTQVGSAPTNPVIAAVAVSTIVVSWTTVPYTTGYEVDASTDSNFGGTLYKAVASSSTSTTQSLNVSGLSPDTTYYLRAGALYNGATVYANVMAGTSTLTDLVSGTQIAVSNVTSLTVNWAPLSAAQGYRLEASSTSFDGTGTVYFSSNTSVSGSTLTVTGLTPGATYAVRVGGINWSGVANFADSFASLNSTVWIAGYDNNSGIAWPIYYQGVAPARGAAVTGMTSFGPKSIALSPDGNTAWVVDGQGHEAWPITTLNTHPTLGTPVTGIGTSGPQSIAITPDGNTAWVSGNSSGGKAWPITNLKSAPTLGSAITVTGANVQNIAITPDGTTAWIPDTNGNKLWPINNLKTTPALGTAVAGFNNPIWVAITPDGAKAWVADGSSGRAYPVTGLQGSPALGSFVGGMTKPQAVAIAPDGNTAWFTDYLGSAVWPINNLKTTPVLGTAITGITNPNAIAITPDGNTAWVTSGSTNQAWPIRNLKTSPALGTPLDGAGFPISIAITPYVVSYATMTTAPTPPPQSPSIGAVAVSSITAVWTSTSPSSGYEVDAATSSDFGGTILSTVTTNGSATTLVVDSMTSLAPDTTYYLRAGNLYIGSTVYSPTILSTSTLTSPITHPQIYQAYPSSMTINWTALSAAQGYVIQVSSYSDFSLIAASSRTTDVALSTLTVSGLTAGTAYYVRVGGINWQNVVNYVAFGSGVILAGAAPSPVNLGAVYITSATVTYGTVGGSSGYELDASSTNFVGGSVMSSTTVNSALGTLTVTGLIPDTTYFLKVGSLWNGPTTYSLTQPSTSTLTNLLSPSTLSVSSFTVRAGWPAFAINSGTNTAQGYRFEAYTDAGYTSLAGSSVTTSVALSSLTINGLAAYTTYYLRAGAINWQNVVNYVAFGSTVTLAGAAPSSVNLGAVYITSATVTYGTVTGTGYELDASSTNFAGGVTLSSVTANNSLASLTVTGLIPDTTYYLQVGALWNGATTYSGTQPSTSTLTNLLTPSTLSVSSFTVRAGWPAFAINSGTNTAQGYRFEAYTDAGYTSLAGSSVTTSVALSSLTINGLTAYTTYYLRAGAINWQNVVNYVAFGSTVTLAGAAPNPVNLGAVYITSATVTYGTVAGTGYELDASSTNFVGGVTLSSTTTNSSLTGLTVTGLIPDTTYFLKVGSLWNGATTYSGTQLSTSTLTDLLTPSTLSVSSFTVRAGWPAFAINSGTNTAQGYRFEAYTDAGYTSLAGSSVTTSVALSSLTINGLAAYTTYYLRAGAIDWQNVVNYVAFGSTVTLAGAAPSPVNLGAVYITSATITYGTVGGSGGYELDASSTNFVGGEILSSTTVNNALGSLTVSGLIPDTTYYLKVGSLWNGATTYSGTQPSTSTLTNLLTPSTLSVSSFTVIAGWPAFALNSGTNTAQGYRFEAYTDAGYTSLAGSSVTTSVALSSLTINGLAVYTTYYLRAGAINWQNIVNYVDFGSTVTLAGAAPSPVNLGAVYITSATVTYGTVGGSGGYELDASSTNFTDGVTLSSTTTDNNLAGLTVTGLIPDTTYFLKVGSLWNGATTYSATILSTATLTSPISNAQLYQVFSTSMTVNWAPLTAAQGYRLEASSTNFNGTGTILFSSNTSVSASTLTVTGLLPNTGYALRVGGVNWNGVANETSIPLKTNYAAWVADVAGHEVWPIYNLNTTPVLGTAVTGMSNPNVIKITPDATTAWVADSSANLWPINNLQTTPVLGTAVSGFTGTRSVAITPDGNTAWVGDGTLSGTLTPVNNLATSPVIGTPVTGFATPTQVEITPDGTTALATNPFSANVHVLNNLNTTPTSGGTASGFSVPVSIAMMPDNNTAWVSDQGTGKVWPITGLKTSPVRGTAVSGMTAAGPSGLALSPDGNTLWVADAPGGKVWPINNVQSSPTLGTAITGMTINGPTSLAFTPDGQTLWVADKAGGKVWPVTHLTTTPTLGAPVDGMTTNGLVFIAISSMNVLNATLTPALTGAQIYHVTSTSITVNWAPLASGSGYRLDVSTDSVFNGVVFSSVTTSLSVSTLTLSGLSSNTVYYVRVGGFNASGVANYTALGSTTTLAATTPTGFQIGAVSVSSITVVWTSTSPSGGYDVEAATSSDFGGTLLSTATPDATATTLVVDSMTSLAPDTTYYLRIGNLYLGSTIYSPTTLSTSTLTSAITNAQVYQMFSTSMTVNWPPLAAAQGYRVEASSTGFNGTGTIYFSSNTTAAVSTLTVTGLDPNIAYSIRVGGLNWNSVPNYTLLPRGSRLTAYVGDDSAVVPVFYLDSNNPRAGVPAVTPLVGVGQFAFAPDGGTVWFPSGGGTVWPLTHLNSIPTLGTAVTGMSFPAHLAITPDGTTLWVTDNGKVYAINNIQTSPTVGSTTFTITGAWAIAITPDGNTAWVTGSTGKAWPINNLKTSPVLGTAVTGMGTGSPQDIAITPDGSTAWVADYTNGKIWPINNLGTSPVLGTAVSGLGNPFRIKIEPDGSKAFVLDGNNKVWPINALATSPAVGTAVTGFGMTLVDMAMTPDGSALWVTASPSIGGYIWPITNLTGSPALGSSVLVASKDIYTIGIGQSPAPATTLAPPLTNAQIYKVNVTSITVNWTPAGSAAGYELDMSTDSAFGVYSSSISQGVSLSTLTISSLNANTTYYVRVGAMNDEGSVNYVSVGSTTTLLGPPPNNLAISTVRVSTITVSWSFPSQYGQNGFVVLASTAQDFTGTVFISTTASASVNTLTAGVPAPALSPNTTYFLNAGEIYNGTTVYSPTVLSTSTWANAVTPQFYFVGNSSMAVAWPAFPLSPSSMTAEGYRLDVSTKSTFNPIWASSTTTDVAFSTLTVTLLGPSTTYFVRVGALNWDNVFNYVTLSSTQTQAVGCSTITSVANGAWSSSSTWDKNVVPTSCNPVHVISGTTVTLDIGTAIASTTTIDGQLSFSRVANSTLTIVGGNVYVMSGGTLDMGTRANPINVSSATLVLAYGATAEQYELQNNGTFTVYGSTKTSWSLYTGGDITTGTSSLSVADATGWQIGDTLLIDADVVTINGAVSGNTVPITAPALAHSAATPIVISNLTHNVVVRSSGTTTASNVAYIENTNNTAGSFVLTYGELAYIGSPSGNGIWPHGGQGTTISSSSIHDGGLFQNGNGAFSGNYQLTGNVFFKGGIDVTPDQNRIVGNVVAAGYGIAVEGSKNAVISNYAFQSVANPAGGIGMAHASNNVVAYNTLHDNVGGIGIEVDYGSSNNLLAGNVMYQNAVGVRFDDGGAAVTNNTLIGETIFNNTGEGIHSYSSTGNQCVNCKIGYSTAGVSSPEGAAEVQFDNTANDFVLKGSSVNPTPGILASNFAAAGAYVLNYSTNPGVVQLYGNYKVAGSTMTLDYANPLYTSTATAVNVVWGSESASNFTVTATVDAKAVSQLITLTASDASHWVVSGSATAGTVTIANNGSGSWPATNSQVTISIGNATATAGDTAYLGLIAASGDANKPKTLYFGPSATSGSTWNNNTGRSKLEIAPSGGFHAFGAAGNPTTVSMLGGSTYYAFVDSGTFQARYAGFTFMDENGIQLSGSGPFAVDHSTFDDVAVAPVSTLFTLNGVTQSTITLTDVTYGDHLLSGANHNITLAGATTGLSWTNQDYSGDLTGDAFEQNDPSNLIQWNIGIIPPDSPAIGAVDVSSITVTWSPVAPSNGYVVEASTASDFSGPLVSTHTGDGTLGSLVVDSMTSLAPNTTYFLRVGTLGTGTTAYSPTSLSTSTLTTSLTGVTITAIDYGSIRLTWNALSGGQGEGYRLDASIDPAFATLAASSITFDTALSTLTLQGLVPQTTYYLRVGGLNWNDMPNFTVFGATETASAGTPTNLVGTALGVSSMSWTWDAVAGATLYNLYDAASTTTLIVSQAGNSFDEIGLSTNTAYGRVVTAVVSGVESALSAPTTSFTWAAVPSSPTFSTIFFTSATVTWTSQGNPGNTRYQIALSTDVSFATAVSTPVAFADSLTALTTTMVNLLPATTYYVHLQAENGDDRATDVSTGSVVTQALGAPGHLIGTALGVSSITWTWDVIPEAASYTIYQATSPTTVVASGVSGPSYNEVNLSTNTAYGRVVAAVDVSGHASGLSAAATTYTLAAVPDSPVFSAVGYSSFTITWTGNTNPAGTVYQVSYSSDVSFATGVSTIPFSKGLTNVTTAFFTLTPATTYYVRLQAENGDAKATDFSAVADTVTFNTSAPTGLSPTVLGVSSISWTWDMVPGATLYNLYDAASTTTLIISQASNSFTDIALSTNTAYGRVVTAVINGNESPLSAPTTAYTFAAVPSSPTFSNVLSTSFTVTWTANTNPAGTRYQVSTSTDVTFATDVSMPIAFTDSFTGLTTSFAGLTPATTYYVHLRAENGDDQATDVSTGSVVTQALGVPANLHGTALGVSSITWTWDVIPEAASYTLYQATSPTTVIASGVSGPLYTEVNLSTNTAYSRVVAAVDALGHVSGLSASTATYTLAAVPDSPAFSTVGYSSFTITWTGNANPAGTVYQVSYSSDVSFATGVSTIPFSKGLTNVTTAFFTLTPATTYYVRLQAENGDAKVTDFSALADTVTLNVPTPTGLSATVLGVSSISWTWNPVPGASAYRLYEATSTTTQVIQQAGTTFIETNLSTNTAYGRVLTAIVNGMESPLSTPQTAYTFAATPGQPTFSNVGVSSFTVTWAINGNPNTTAYEVSYSTDSTFAIAVSTPVKFSDTLTANTTDITGLSAATTYYVRIRAENGDAVITPFSLLGSTETFQAGIPANFAGTALGVSSISWTWGSVAGVTSYNVYESSDPTTLVASVGTTSFIETNLSTNTAYGRFVTAVVQSVESLPSNSTTTYTWAAPPTNTQLTSVTTTAIVETWNANGNPTGTLYQAQLAQASDFSGQVASVTANTGIPYTLNSNATYYLQVRAQNGDGVTTAFDTVQSTVTPAAIPINGNFDVVLSSIITVSWDGSTNAAGTNYQVDLSTISDVGATTATIVTSGFTATFTGLSADTTYYAHVKALGWTGEDSGSLIIGHVITPLVSPDGFAFTQVYYSSTTLSWQPTGGGVEYEVQLSSGGPFATYVSSLTFGTSADFGGLDVNTQLSARLRSVSPITGNTSTWSAIISSYTLANAPVNLSTSAITNTSVTLVWDANGNPANTLYGVERSTNGVLFTQVVTQLTTTYADSTLTPGTFYQYRVRAFNGSLIPTAYDGPIQILTPGSVFAPKRPTGLWAERESVGLNTFNVTFHWHAVTERTDGSALTTLTGYQIYTTQSVLTPRDTWTFKTLSPTESWSLTVPSDVVTYYAIRAVDASGAVSAWSDIMDDSADMNHLFISPDDDKTRASIPQSGADVLRREHNNYGADVRLEWSEVNTEESGRIVRSMQCRAYNESTDSEITNLVFGSPAFHVIVAYAVQNGNVVTGAPLSGSTIGQARVPVINAAQADKELALFWYDGVEWVKAGGQVDMADDTVSLVGTHAGRFQVRIATRPGLTLARVYPRIITPNGDGWNDKAIFQFDNPADLPLSGKIFDLSGAWVANLQPGAVPDSTLMWDGKDSGGTVVPSGIYLYQVEVDGAHTTGTVVVAR